MNKIVRSANDNLLILQSGTFFDLKNPRTEQLHLRDMAIGISTISRFGGHVEPKIGPYTVGHHSYLGSYYFDDPLLSLKFLMHDTPEAYIGDIPSPLKTLDICSGLVALDKKLLNLISHKFVGRKKILVPEVKRLDKLMGIWECYLVGLVEENEAREASELHFYPKIESMKILEIIENKYVEYHTTTAKRVELFCQRYFDLAKKAGITPPLLKN